jgi:hypothetical protein
MPARRLPFLRSNSLMPAVCFNSLPIFQSKLDGHGKDDFFIYDFTVAHKGLITVIARGSGYPAAGKCFSSKARISSTILTPWDAH